MADLLVSINGYQVSLGAASSRDTNSIGIKNQNRADLTNILIGLGNYVTLTANGDMDALRSSLFIIRKTNEPTAPLELPQDIKAADGVNAGEIVISVARVKFALAYVLQYAVKGTEGGTWINTNCSSSRCIVKGLTQGVNYIFRMGAVGARGQVTYSNTITRISQ